MSFSFLVKKKKLLGGFYNRIYRVAFLIEKCHSPTVEYCAFRENKNRPCKGNKVESFYSITIVSRRVVQNLWPS